MMMALKLLCLVFVCCCFVECSSKEDVSIYDKGFIQPKGYFGFLHDVNRKIQFLNSNNGERTAKSARIVSMIRKLYQPLVTTIEDRYPVSDTPTYFANSEQISTKNNDEALNNLYNEYNSLRDRANVSSTCINDTGRLIVNIIATERWAVQFLDASGKPGPALLKYHFGFVGDYDECLSAKSPQTKDGNTTAGDDFFGNYCIVTLLTEIPGISVSLGVCLPDTCSSTEITQLMYDILGYPKMQPPIVDVITQCMTPKTEITTSTVFAILILSLIGVFVCFGTLYDILAVDEDSDTQTQTESVQKSRRIRHNTSYESISSLTEKDWNRSPTNGENASLFDRTRNQTMSALSSSKKGTFAKILLSFSLYSNSKKILNTSQSSGSLGAIHGIRFLSMSWVVLGHMYSTVLYFAMNSSEEMIELFKRWTFLPIVNGLVSVDTFFTLSGLLTSYVTIQEMSRRNTWKINWGKFYFHRFWRLTPPYMFTLVIFLGLQQYMGSGPLWVNKQPYDKDYCDKNWWTNLLYINNIANTNEGCFGHAWYLANDMQFFLLSPLMLIPFYFSRIAGMLSCFLILFVSWTTTGVLSTNHKWPITPETLKPVPGRASELEWMKHYYLVPWCRIGPFVVGIMAGYILALSKGRPFTMNRFLVIVGWVTAIASGLAIVYGIRGDVTGDNPSSLSTSAFYNAVHRTVWGACVAWVVIACSAGYGGPINKLLSWSPFLVLGRLTYMSYLIHPNLLAVFFGNFGALYFANDSTMAIFYLGLLVFVNMAAFVSTLGLESPMVGLEKAFIRKERNEG